MSIADKSGHIDLLRLLGFQVFICHVSSLLCSQMYACVLFCSLKVPPNTELHDCSMSHAIQHDTTDLPTTVYKYSATGIIKYSFDAAVDCMHAKNSFHGAGTH